jgi:hypothetical protein
MIEAKWEQVQNSRDRETLRMRVPHGWLYNVIEKGDHGSYVQSSVIFVPDTRWPDLEKQNVRTK